MPRAFVALLGAALVACQSASPPGYEESVSNGLLVLVVDARTGAPVPGAEVIVSPTGTESPDPAVIPPFHELLLSGQLGATDRFGRRWRCDDQGQVRVPMSANWNPIVARTEELWGCWVGSGQRPEPSEITITAEPEESLQVVCTDPVGRPGVGAIVWTQAKPSEASTGDFLGSSLTRGERVLSPDGHVLVPHAQFWRACAARGFDVRIAGGVLWSSEMLSEVSRAFPMESGSELHFDVSSSGFVDVQVQAQGLSRIAMLRWLDPPPDPDDPDDVPEFPIGIGAPGTVTSFGGIPLGHRYELVAEVRGWIDPRVAFDGPKTHGEHVPVELRATQRAARVTGTLVDVKGKPIVGHTFEAWIERGGERREPEEDWLQTDDQGKFELDFAPLESNATLVFDVDGSQTPWLGPDAQLTLGAAATQSHFPARLGARHEFPQGLAEGLRDIGAVHCETMSSSPDETSPR